MATLCTHVLDTAAGRPAAGIAVLLEIARRRRARRRASPTMTAGSVRSGGELLEPGDYVLRFDTASYVERSSIPRSSSCSPSPTSAHYHVPLLLIALRLLDLPWQLSSGPAGRPRPARGRRRARDTRPASPSRRAGSPRSRRTTTPRPPPGGHARRRRGAAARPGRHPRARQRARPHRVGGLRHARPARRRPAASPRSSTCRSTPSRRPPRSPRWREARWSPQGRCFVDVGFWGGAVPATSPIWRPLHEAGVFGFKCFLLDSGVPEFPHLDAGRLRAAMAETARLGALMIVHAEDGYADRRRPRSTAASYAGFLASRPRAAEEAAIALVVEQARGDRRPGARGAPQPTRTPCPALRAARADGVDVIGGDLPALPDLRRRARRPTAPPSSSAARRSARPPTARRSGPRWRAGDIDFVVSDHSPCTRDAQALGSGDFGAAWGGISSVQLGLPAVWTGARARGHSLADVVRWMATAPAARVGLDRPRAGSPSARDADLVRFAPDEAFTVDAVDAAPPQPGLGLRRATAGGRGTGDLAARRTGRRRAAPRGRLLRGGRR